MGNALRKLCCLEAINSNDLENPVNYEAKENLVMQKDERLVYAMFTYTSHNPGDLCFNGGDKLIVKPTNDKSWLQARMTTDSRNGIIPANYVTDDPLGRHMWFVGTLPRHDCEKRLFSSSVGTFLIRNSERGGGLVLSVRFEERSKHFKIRQMDDSKEYFISKLNTFKTLEDLVSFYQQEDSGLMGGKLGNACLRPVPPLPDLCYEIRNQWEIPRENIQLMKQLGEGYYGTVWYGLWNCSTEIAVKKLKPDRGMDSRAFLEEASILKKLKHENIVRLYGVCSETQPIYIITEFMVNGSLQDYLKKKLKTNDLLKSGQFLDICVQVAKAMHYLETLFVKAQPDSSDEDSIYANTTLSAGQVAEYLVHRDLAARNCLVGYDNVVKVTDFGLARTFSEDEETYMQTAQNAKLPIKWTAPEALYERKFTTKSDVWSFGILVWEVYMYGRMPYPEHKSIEIYPLLKSGYRMPRPENCPQEVYDMMLQCWNWDAVKRPTFEYIFHYLDDYFVTSAGDGYVDQFAA